MKPGSQSKYLCLLIDIFFPFPEASGQDKKNIDPHHYGSRIICQGVTPNLDECISLCISGIALAKPHRNRFPCLNEMLSFPLK